MAVFGPHKSLKSISRKIWVAGNFWNFHTMMYEPSKSFSCIDKFIFFSLKQTCIPVELPGISNKLWNFNFVQVFRINIQFLADIILAFWLKFFMDRSKHFVHGFYCTYYFEPSNGHHFHEKKSQITHKIIKKRDKIDKWT